MASKISAGLDIMGMETYLRVEKEDPCVRSAIPYTDTFGQVDQEE